MDDIFLNIISAAAIGLIIFTMSLLKRGHLKALVYSLPIPITIALVATNGHVNETNVIGLIILCLFLWATYWQVNRSVNIYLADILASIGYVAIGYIAISYIKASFLAASLVYLITWLLFILFYRHEAEKKTELPAKIQPILKLPVVTLLAFVLLSLKSHLAGIVVTFPFSGVFAVVESRRTLRTLAAVFTRNSIAILALFLAMYYLDSINFGLRILAGWLVYLGVLMITIKIVKYA